MASTVQPVTVSLYPLGWTNSFTRARPEFSFENVPDGDYTLVVMCSALGGAFPPMPLTVSGEDVSAEVVLPFPQLPRHLPELMLNAHSDRLRRLAFSPDGSELVSASDDGTVTRWDTAGGEPNVIWRYGNANPHLPLELSPDGTALAAGANNGTGASGRARKAPCCNCFRVTAPASRG